MNDKLIMEREFRVDKIQCEGCEATIEKLLLHQDGVIKVRVLSGTVHVSYNPLLVRFDALPKVTEEAGFPRFFRFSEEHHQDYLWRQEEEKIISRFLGRPSGSWE